MKEYFTLDGKSSRDFGCFLADSNMLDAPERDIEEIEVPGRSGNLLIDNGRYGNFTANLTVYFPKDVKMYADAFKAWILSKTTYVRYEESTDLDIFRMVRFSGAFKMSGHDHVGGYADLEFSCKPQKYLKNGEQKTEFTKSGMMYNHMLYEALPLIRVYGYGTLAVGSGSVTIFSNSKAYIDIDCDIKDAYCGSENCNNLISVSSDWPTLEPGENQITLPSTISKVEITPRWWTI